MIFVRLTVLTLFAAIAAGSAMAQIAPHRAVYTLSLDSISGSNSISGASGRMILDWADVCDGWATELDLRVRLFDPEGEELRFGTALNTWEAKDGRVLRFRVKDRSTYFPSTNLVGRAVLDKTGAGEAHYSEPSDMTIQLPKGTLFPTAHSLAVLEAAEAGQQVMVAPLFDGSEEGQDALMEASAVILGPFEDKDTRIASLASIPYYKVNLAFYRTDDKGALPTHEATLRLYENGVVDRQLFDYGDFVLAADISELTYHPDADC